MNYDRKHLILSSIIFLVMGIPVVILVAFLHVSEISCVVIGFLAGLILAPLAIFIVNRII